MQKKGFGGATEAQIADWKKKYQKVVGITIQIDEELLDSPKAEFVVRQPDMAVIYAVASKKDDLAAANKILIKNCVLSSNDEKYLNDDHILMTLLGRIGELVEAKKSEIKNL